MQPLPTMQRDTIFGPPIMDRFCPCVQLVPVHRHACAAGAEYWLPRGCSFSGLRCLNITQADLAVAGRPFGLRCAAEAGTSQSLHTPSDRVLFCARHRTFLAISFEFDCGWCIYPRVHCELRTCMCGRRCGSVAVKSAGVAIVRGMCMHLW